MNLLISKSVHAQKKQKKNMAGITVTWMITSDKKRHQYYEDGEVLAEIYQQLLQHPKNTLFSLIGRVNQTV